jgi:hypothetical protein
VKRAIHSSEFIDALIASDIVKKDDHVTRVIIDAKADHVVTIYVERIGDERLYDLLPAISKVEIKEDEP